MAKKTSDSDAMKSITNPNAGVIAPAWMKNAPAVGVEASKKYQTPSRMSIVQPQSGRERREEFGEGSVILTPELIPIAPIGEDGGFFIGIPIALFVTWEKWSDTKDKQSPMVVETTMDERSELAAKSRRRETRKEKYGNDFTARYVEVHNFFILLDSGEEAGEVVLTSFASGELWTGKRLSKLIARRARRYNASIFDNRVKFSTKIREGNGFEWYGFEFSNPDPEKGEGFALIDDEDRHNTLRKYHEEAESIIAAGKVSIVRDDDDEVGVVSDGGNDADDDIAF